MKKIVFWLIVFVVLFSMWGYGNVGGDCVTDVDCGGGGYCLSGACKERPVVCANNSNCLPNQFCQAGICANITEEICNNTLDDNGDNLVDCADSDCAGQTGPNGLICGQEVVAHNLITENCTNGIDDDGDGLYDCEDDECWDKESCVGEFCKKGTDKIVVWSWMPTIKIKVGCCEETQCINFQDNCQDYGEFFEMTRMVGGTPLTITSTGVICGDENNWYLCNESIKGEIFNENLYCNGSQWIPVEKNCSDGLNDNKWGGTDCADPTCDQRERCEYAKELTCNDGFDNDRDAPLTFVPVGGAIYQPVPEETNKESWWDNLKRILWGRKGAVAGEAFGGELKPVGTPVSPEPKITMKEICNDSQDNDGDNLTDCDDPDCADSPACLHLGVREISPYEPGPGFGPELPEFKPLRRGTDCQDSDCEGRPGPNNHVCCYDASDCPGKGAACVNNQCKETSCSNNQDDDGDGKTDCQDSNCAKKKCKAIKGEDWRCVEEECKEIPKWIVGVEVKKPVQIFSYKDISGILNKCKVREGEGNSCTEICQAGEKGFPTKGKDNKILRCTCC